jgi:hypothetical protein
MDDQLYRAYYVGHLPPIWFDVQYGERVERGSAAVEPPPCLKA